MKHVLVAIVAVLFLLCNQAFSEPHKAVSYLMNDSFTMFDWGLYTLEKTISQIKLKNIEGTIQHASVEYDWDADRVNIRLTAYPKYESLKKNGAKRVCSNALVELKEFFGYGKSSEFKDLFGIHTFFSHKGFIRKNEPENLEKDLENITKVTLYVYASKTDKAPFSNQATCTSRLFEKDIYFIDDQSTK